MSKKFIPIENVSALVTRIQQSFFRCSKHGTFPRPSNFVEHPIFLNGLMEFVCDVQENITVDKSTFVRVEGNAVKFTNFQPGSVIIFRLVDEEFILQYLTSFMYQ